MKAEQEHGSGDEDADRPPGRPAPVVALGDAEHEDAEPGGDEQGAEDVEARLALVAALGEKHRRHDQRDDPDRDVDVEDPRPRQEVDEDAAEQDAGCGADAADRTPRAEGDVALTALAEHGGQDREGGRGDRGRTEALECAGGDERALTPGEAAQQRPDREDDEPDHEDAPATEQVGEAAAEQQEATEDEGVGRDDPLQVLLRESEVGLDRGQRNVDDRDVQHHHELHHAEQQQGDPLAPV